MELATAVVASHTAVVPVVLSDCNDDRVREAEHVGEEAATLDVAQNRDPSLYASLMRPGMSATATRSRSTYSSFFFCSSTYVRRTTFTQENFQLSCSWSSITTFSGLLYALALNL